MNKPIVIYSSIKALEITTINHELITEACTSFKDGVSILDEKSLKDIETILTYAAKGVKIIHTDQGDSTCINLEGIATKDQLDEVKDVLSNTGQQSGYLILAGNLPEDVVTFAKQKIIRNETLTVEL